MSLGITPGMLVAELSRCPVRNGPRTSHLYAWEESYLDVQPRSPRTGVDHIVRERANPFDCDHASQDGPGYPRTLWPGLTTKHSGTDAEHRTTEAGGRAGHGVTTAPTSMGQVVLTGIGSTDVVEASAWLSTVEP